MPRWRPQEVTVGWALFLGSGVSSAFAAALATKTFDQVSPAAGTAFSIALAGLLAVAIGRPRTDGWSSARWQEVGAFGAVIFANVIALYLALDRLPLGTTITIEFLGPLGLAVVHAKRWTDYLAALTAVSGVALVTGAGGAVDFPGISLALVAASCWATYTVIGKRVGAYRRPLDSLLVALGVGGALAIPLAVVACFQIGSARILLLLMAVAVLGRMLPYGLELAGLRRMAPGIAGVLFSIIPAIAAVIGFLILGQSYTAVQALGFLVVIVAGGLAVRGARP